MAVACSIDNRAPGLPGEMEGRVVEPPSAAGTGGVPDVVDPPPPASGGVPGRNAIAAAGSGGAGNSAASLPGAGGSPGANGGAGSSMVPVGGAGGNTFAGSGGTAVLGAGAGGSSGASGVENSGLVLSPTEGWVDAQSNTAGVQGGLFFEVDSSAGGPSTLRFVSSGPAVCVEGVAGPVQDMDYARDWGAQFGLGLGQPSPSQTGSWSQATPLGQLTSITFTLTGSQIPPAALRFAVEDAAGTSYCAALVGSSGTFTIPVTQLAEACWEPAGAPLTSGLLLSALTWTINSQATGAVPFDFCVENLTLDVE
jgi:hypothetical protein